MSNKVEVNRANNIIRMDDMPNKSFGIVAAGSYEGHLIQRVKVQDKTVFVDITNGDTWDYVIPRSLKVEPVVDGSTLTITVG